VDPERFVDELAHMSEHELRAVADLVRHDALSAEGELSWWRATSAVAASLKATRSGRHAATVAHHAVQSVMLAAERCGMLTEDRDQATAVARAAADAARAMVADPQCEGTTQVLVAPFRPVVLQPF
jgi:UDP-3-O-acyl-N-acetylglucosamine deacetylase